MKKLGFVAALLSAGMFMGCASTSATGDSTTSTAADAATGAAAQEAAAVEAAKAPDAPKSNMIANECKINIRQMVTKQEGGQQYLLEDGTLWQVMPDGSTKLVKKLPDAAENYQLIPSTDVIIHFTPEKIMLVHVESDKEFFYLKGDPSLRKVMFTPDNNIMGILDQNATVHIWNVPDKFTGINFSERVQDFINRQSPDHNLHFTAGSYNISLSGDDRAVLAVDNEAESKNGLIYYMDETKHKGSLKAIGRTNAHINHLAASLSGNYVAATVESGQLFVTSTGEDKGFKMYAKSYTDAQNVKFIGDNVLVIGAEKLTLLDINTGMEMWVRDVKAKTCFAPSNSKLICNTGDTIEEIDATNGKLVRTLFFNDKEWGELKNGTELGGTVQASCLK